MERSLKRRIAVLLVMSLIALASFFRSPGSEGVRWVQVLLLFTGGMCAGVALALYRIRRQLQA
jgi:hypothetical protein